MTLEQYYIMVGALGFAGAAFILFAVVQCGKMMLAAFLELAAIEDYEG